MSETNNPTPSVMGDTKYEGNRQPQTGTKELPVSETLGGGRAPDIRVWNELEKVFTDHDHSRRHLLELWPAYVRRIHLARFLAHYELFRQVIDLPGCIVELGVYRGPSFFTWHKLMETFCPGDRSRQIFGFDSFEGLRNLHPKDGKPFPQCGKVEGGWSAEAVRDEVRELVRIHNMDNFIKEGKPRSYLIEGDLTKTLPAFLEENPGLRISLLHLDVDLYEPTMVGLKHLYPLVTKGGIVVFDEYGIIPWGGEATAVDEYFKEIGEAPVIRSFPYTTQPQGYMIK